MADILPFKKSSAAAKGKGKSLCRHGHHKWVVCKKKQFDVRQGRLVTVYRCPRCGKQKVVAQ
jgi:hypothetical protein